jgi:hypothetical protein
VPLAATRAREWLHTPYDPSTILLPVGREIAVLESTTHTPQVIIAGLRAGSLAPTIPVRRRSHPARPAILAENLHRHPRASGNRDQRRARSSRAPTRGRASPARPLAIGKRWRERRVRNRLLLKTAFDSLAALHTFRCRRMSFIRSLDLLCRLVVCVRKNNPRHAYCTERAAEQRRKSGEKFLQATSPPESQAIASFATTASAVQDSA